MSLRSTPSSFTWPPAPTRSSSIGRRGVEEHQVQEAARPLGTPTAGRAPGRGSRARGAAARRSARARHCGGPGRGPGRRLVLGRARRCAAALAKPGGRSSRCLAQGAHAGKPARCAAR